MRIVASASVLKIGDVGQHVSAADPQGPLQASRRARWRRAATRAAGSGLLESSASWRKPDTDVSADQASLDRYDGGPSKLIAAFITAVACALAKGNAHIATNTSALLRSHAEQHGNLALLHPPLPGPEADLLDEVLG